MKACNVAVLRSDNTWWDFTKMVSDDAFGDNAISEALQDMYPATDRSVGYCLLYLGEPEETEI